MRVPGHAVTALLRHDAADRADNPIAAVAGLAVALVVSARRGPMIVVVVGGLGSYWGVVGALERPRRLLEGSAASGSEAEIDLRCRWGGQGRDGAEASDRRVYRVAYQPFDVDVVGGGEPDPNDTFVEQHVGTCVEHVGVSANVGLERVGERSAVDIVSPGVSSATGSRVSCS